MSGEILFLLNRCEGSFRLMDRRKTTTPLKEPARSPRRSPKVRESEAKYRALFEALDEGFCVVEVLFDADQRPVDYRFLETNPAFFNQTGLKDAAGKLMRELAPNHEEYWFQIYGRIALTGEPQRFQNLAAALGFWYDVYAFRIGPAKQRRVGILFRDITKQRQTEEALRRSEERLRRAFAIETVGVIFFSADGLVTDANDAFLRMAGYTREDLKRGEVHWDVMTPPEWMPRSREALAELKLTGRTTPYEKEYLRKDGSRWWGLFAASGIGENQGVEFVIDISEKKQAEQALSETRKALEQSNEALEKVVEERTAKLRDLVAELHQVSYAMVHDMRAPLRAMRGFAELLDAMNNPSTPPVARDYRRRIVLAAERLDHLVTDALNYTKILDQEPQIQPVDLHQLIHELIETYPNLHSDHAEIIIERHLPTVLGNKALLTQCFSNLLGNAVKFVAPGVKPRVRVWHEMIAGECREQRCVRIWVEDNGIGIPKEVQGRMFQIFHRFHDDYPGTGIGLAIVRKVADRMGGSVGVESEPGRGSKFWVNIPAAEGES
jgi:PAS domain S-box-containing protein